MPAKRAPARKAAAKKTTAKKAPARKAPVKKAAPKKERKTPVEFSQELVELVCDRIADGDTLDDICAEPGMPSRKTFYRWRKEHEDARDAFGAATEVRVERYVDETIKISDEKILTKEDAARQKARIAARQWYAEKLVPKLYGQKIGIGGAEGLPPVKGTLDVDLTLSPSEVYRQVVKGLR